MREATRDQNRVMDAVRATVFKKSESLDGESGCTKIEGYDFNRGVDYPQLLNSLLSTGFQASNLGEAIQIVNEMVCFITSKKMFFLGVSVGLCLALNSCHKSQKSLAQGVRAKS